MPDVHSYAELLLTLGAPPPNAEDIETLPGAIYNDSSDPAKATNDAAIADFIDSLPYRSYTGVYGYGALMRLASGHLYIGDTIVYPKPLIVEGTPTNRPMNFGIVGDGVSSRIVKPDGGRAIEMISGTPNQYPDRTCRWVLRDLTIDGGQYIDGSTANAGNTGGLVHIEHGGKFLEFENVRITGSTGVGLRMIDLTGGGFKDVYIHENAGDGVVMENCIFLDLFKFISRQNVGRGFFLTEWPIADGGTGAFCNTLSGMLYAESNGGLGVDMNLLERSNIHFWLEANGGGVIAGGDTFLYFQAKARNCTNNRFEGTTHWPRSWDLDAVSRDANVLGTAPLGMPHVGTTISGAISLTVTGGGPSLHVSGAVATFDIGALAVVGTKIIEVANADTGSTVFAVGDYVEIEATFTFDSALQAYLATHLEWLYIGLAGGTSADSIKVNYNGTNKVTTREYFRMSSAGTGIHAYLVFLPTASNAAALAMTVTQFDVRFLDNTP